VPANVGSPNQNFVDQLYRDALHRAPDPAAQGWVQSLDSGRLSRGDVAVQVLGSDEGLRTRVNDLYVRFLGRQADAGGVNYWTDFLRRDGHSDTDLAARLIGSPEYFQTQGGGTNAGFLNALYQDVLCRSITQNELGDRSDDLRDDSRDEVAQDVLESDEARSDQVQGVFTSYLRRQASGNDRNEWSHDLDGGLSGSFQHDVPNAVEDNDDLLFAAQIFGSAEYFRLSQTLTTSNFATIPTCGPTGLAAPGTPGFGSAGTGTSTLTGSGTGTTTGTGTGM